MFHVKVLSYPSLRRGTEALLHPPLEWNLGFSLRVLILFILLIFFSFFLFEKETHSLALKIPPTL